MRRAAELMRERAKPAVTPEWGAEPWHAEECTARPRCACIVAQGERRPADEAQVPPIRFVCDAENPVLGTYIASWHPGVALAVADLLDRLAWTLGLDPDLSARVGCDEALEIARAYLGEGDGS